METSLPKSEKMKEIILKESFRPLLKLLIESKCIPSCADLSEMLSWFQYTGFLDTKKNSIQVRFDDLKRMYFTNEIPLNVFWISSINTDCEDYHCNPFNFLNDLDTISQNIINNSFEQTHEWFFDHEGNSGVFLNFYKTTETNNQFISIFIAFKNGEGIQTLTQIKKGK